MAARPHSGTRLPLRPLPHRLGLLLREARRRRRWRGGVLDADEDNEPSDLTDQQTINAVMQELNLPVSPEAVEFIENLKTRQTAVPGFNLCAHHDELVRGKPHPKDKKPVPASRKQMHGELLRASVSPDAVIQMDTKVKGMKPSRRETKDMLFSLHAYTRSEIYRAFNRDHRELNVERWAAISSTMHCAVERAQSPDDGTTLYRGDSRESYSPSQGQLDRFDQFTSTSTNRAVAHAFAGDRWMFEISGVPPTQCAHIGHASMFPFEAEVLVTPGATFRVESVSKASRPHVVKLRFGADGTPASCMWCQLESDFNITSLVTSTSQITDFGRMLARKSSLARPFIDGPCYNCFDANGQPVQGEAALQMNRPLLVSAAGQGKAAMVDLLLSSFGLSEEDVQRRYEANGRSFAMDALHAALGSHAATAGRSDCVAAIVGNCVLRRKSPSAAFNAVVLPRLDAILQEPALERVAELGRNYLESSKESAARGLRIGVTAHSCHRVGRREWRVEQPIPSREGHRGRVPNASIASTRSQHVPDGWLRASAARQHTVRGSGHLPMLLRPAQVAVSIRGRDGLLAAVLGLVEFDDEVALAAAAELNRRGPGGTGVHQEDHRAD